MPQKLVIAIQGPTASGKTSVALELAMWLDTEIISCDSRQFFQELKIGSAPPSLNELNQVRHHFIQHKSVTEDYNAGKYETDALGVIESIHQHHDGVILVGGSGLYADAVLKGFNDLPPANAEIRKNLMLKLEKEGIGALQLEMQKADPDYYAVVDKNNAHRLIRALELIKSSGKKINELRSSAKIYRPFKTILFAMDWPRSELYKRINKRADLMMEEGLLEEVRSLIPHRELQTLNTVGYKELFAYLDGDLTLDEAVELIKRNSRRYAKRQLTWLRRQKDMIWFHPSKIEEMKKVIVDALKTINTN